LQHECDIHALVVGAIASARRIMQNCIVRVSCCYVDDLRWQEWTSDGGIATPSVSIIPAVTFADGSQRVITPENSATLNRNLNHHAIASGGPGRTVRTVV
jgi:hypothetical protein